MAFMGLTTALGIVIGTVLSTLILERMQKTA